VCTVLNAVELIVIITSNRTFVFLVPVHLDHDRNLGENSWFRPFQIMQLQTGLRVQGKSATTIAWFSWHPVSRPKNLSTSDEGSGII